LLSVLDTRCHAVETVRAISAEESLLHAFRVREGHVIEPVTASSFSWDGIWCPARIIVATRVKTTASHGATIPCVAEVAKRFVI